MRHDTYLLLQPPPALFFDCRGLGSDYFGEVPRCVARLPWVVLVTWVSLTVGAVVCATAIAAQSPPATMMMGPGPLGIPMDRMGSGTSWIPEAVALPSHHRMAGSWEIMVHGFASLQYDRQEGPRGDSQLGSLNWGMLMATHDAAGGRLQARVMLSLDPATVSERGYPLLLQSGESYRGAVIHDRQHPHDFWMELGGLFERAITQHVGLSLYAAPVGEPALGPVAFMHRPSAMDNPTAPIGHHWQDATHTTFGVLTAGIFGRHWKLEGSAFNGREPDDQRWNFDRIALGSSSARLTVNPTSQWSLSASFGFLSHPELSRPAESLHRTSASAMYSRTLGETGTLATTVVWGANASSVEPGLTHSALLESEARVDGTNAFLWRAEFVEKRGDELAVPVRSVAAAAIVHVASVSAGYVREVTHFLGLSGGIGLTGTVNVVPGEIAPLYGSRNPLGALLYFRVRPASEPAMMSMPGMNP